MNKIKFNHYFKKMPDSIELLDTWIKDIGIIDYKNLTPEQIEQDTAIRSGGNYTLPKTKLIWIKLWSYTIHGGIEWATLRRYTPQKFEYHSSLVGQQVKVEIEEE